MSLPRAWASLEYPAPASSKEPAYFHVAEAQEYDSPMAPELRHSQSLLAVVVAEQPKARLSLAARWV